LLPVPSVAAGEQQCCWQQLLFFWYIRHMPRIPAAADTTISPCMAKRGWGRREFFWRTFGFHG